MIRNLKIEGYRGIKEFSLSDLGRINLIVGKNSSGKTSLLEAIELFAARGHPRVLGQILARRAELLNSGSLNALFHGHRVDYTQGVRLSEFSESDELSEFSESDELIELTLFIVKPVLFEPPQLMIENRVISEEGYDEQFEYKLPLDSLQLDPKVALQVAANLILTGELTDQTGTIFLPTTPLDQPTFTKMLGKTILTPDEEFFLKAMQHIDPQVKRVATLGEDVFTVIDGVRVPLRSLGDGIWRLGSIALALADARGGFLFIDEIDSGLHYSVMKSMWKMIIKAARDFDVQIFATTHSQDCIHALAVTCTQLEDASDITLQRIQAQRTQAIAYSSEELVLAEECDTEVR